jgi:AraC family transcriptional activator of pobA
MVQQQTLANYVQPVSDKAGYDHLNGGFFAAVRLDDFSAENLAATTIYSRKDFYKISLITGDATYHYRDKAYQIKSGDNVLVFTNRETPYRWEIHNGACSGYSCMFTEDFLPLHTHVRPSDLAVFNDAGYSLIRITQKDRAVFEGLFQKMMSEQASGYKHKYQLLFLYVLECIHTALKLAPETENRNQTAVARLTEAFKQLLNDQFPLVNPFQELLLRSPQAFADKLSVHVNYLNRALKEVTGKTTTQLITERIMQEARSLLLHSNWSIAQISDCLGFDEPTHFTKAFKKATGETPSVLRRMV